MKRTRTVAVLASTTALALGLGACGGGNSNSSSGSGTSSTANAGVGKVFNASDKKGGTLRYANSADWDSLDPADTYYGYSWNFIRNYGRTLTVFKSAPGSEGAKLVGDLA